MGKLHCILLLHRIELIEMEERTKERIELALLLIALGVLLVSPILLLPGYAYGGASTNVTAKLNVSNSEPLIASVLFDDSPITDDGRITLAAGTSTRVYCNASAFDFNGWQDIVNASAIIFVANTTAGSSGINYLSADDSNQHYTNHSCNCTESPIGTQNASCTCAFAMQYYADNGTWVCNFTVRDGGGMENLTNSTQMNESVTDQAGVIETIAVSVPGVIDYGNLSVLETSSEQLMNVTNVGNVDINVTVRGWGGTNATVNDEFVGGNLSMICARGNITLGMERYSFESGTLYDSMTNLTYNDTKIGNIVFRQRRDETVNGNSSNTTYWKIQVPLGVGGICNGTISVTGTRT